MPLTIYEEHREYFENWQHFLSLLLVFGRLRPILLQCSYGDPSGPETLPGYITSFIQSAMSITPEVLASVWPAIRPFLATLDDVDFTADIDDLFWVHGRTHGIGMSFPTMYNEHDDQVTNFS